MPQEIAVSHFDYDGLDKDVKGRLLCVLRDINREKERHEESGMEIGKCIATAHALLVGDGGKDGRFSLWVESECGFCRATAYNYMNAWQRFGSCLTVRQFEPSAIYALAAPSVPDAAVKEAVKMADRGLRITKKTASDLKKRYTSNGKPGGKTSQDRGNGKPHPEDAVPEAPDRGSGAGAGGVELGVEVGGGVDGDAAKLFARLYKLYGELTQLTDQLHNLAPYQDKDGIQVALGMAYENFLKWKRKYKA